MTEKQRLLELYDAERRAYRRYVAVKTGEDLVLANARISETKVAAARDEWADRLGELLDAGGSPAVMAPLLRERMGQATVRRAS